MINKKRALRPQRDLHRSPISKRIMRAVMDGIRTITHVICCGGTHAVSPRLTLGRGIRHYYVAELDRNTQLHCNAENGRQQGSKRHNGWGQLQDRNRNVRNQQTGHVSPHDFSINRATAPRRDKRRENRENQRSECREEACEHIVHDKRPHTQLMLTLRLIWRSGKRIRHNTMACGINSLMRRIRRFSAVSRVRIAALTIPALLLCACAAAHGDDACSAPYASAGQHLHGGRPA